MTAPDPRQLDLPMGARESAPTLEAERASTLVASLPRLTSEGVFAAFEELDDLPPDVVRAALAVVTGPAPDPESLDDVTRRAHGWPLRPLRLRALAVVKDADIFDLGPIAEEQIRIAGRTWDGRDLPAEDRLDGELEGTFAGSLEHRTLADADQPSDVPVFDVLLYAGEAGAIFRAGTTDLVGAVDKGTIEMRDRRARLAVQEALAKPAEQATRIESVESEGAAPPLAESVPAGAPPKKKRAAVKKKARAASTTPKKAAAKKAPAKAAGAKKAAAGAKKAAATPKKSASAGARTKKAAK